MRNVFIDELTRLARKRRNVALIVGDLGYSVVEPFADEFPDRFINAGIAEQNMAGMAAGMASEGYHVFVYSIANFPTFRCAEQIRNDIAYHNLPVTIVSVGGGLAYGSLGYSHHAVQDYALLRTFPNMLIAAPGDPMEVRACMNYLAENPSPSYLRLGKAGEPNFHVNTPNVSPGEWLAIRKTDSGRAFLSTGGVLQDVMERLSVSKYMEYSVYTMPLWSMASKTLQSKQINEFEEVVTVEDHLHDGGFGSWMLEACVGDREAIHKLRPLALDPKVCGIVGQQKILNQLGGLFL